MARVAALIDINGNADTSTALTGVYNTNNPRSVATVDGSTLLRLGSGRHENRCRPKGVSVARRGAGATTATAIDTSTDTRAVEIVNNGSGDTLYVSRDYNPTGQLVCSITPISTV